MSGEDSDNIVPFALRKREDDDGTLTHFIATTPGYPKLKCRHQRFWIDSTNHEITCRDCNAIVQPFDAMLAFANGIKEWQDRVIRIKKESVDLEQWKPWLKAVRDLEGTWRGTMLPCCPHCRKGIEAEELARSWKINRAIATRMREVENGQKNGEAAQPAPETVEDETP